MALVQVDWNPGPKVLSTFAWSLVATGALLGALVAWKGASPTLGASLGGVFALLGVLALVGPKALKRPIYLAFTGPAWLLGNVMSRVIVAVVFYLLITPMGLVARLFGFDPLAVRTKKRSYWSALDTGASKPEDYERPF